MKYLNSIILRIQKKHPPFFKSKVAINYAISHRFMVENEMKRYISETIPPHFMIFFCTKVKLNMSVVRYFKLIYDFSYEF